MEQIKRDVEAARQAEEATAAQMGRDQEFYRREQGLDDLGSEEREAVLAARARGVELSDVDIAKLAANSKLQDRATSEMQSNIADSQRHLETAIKDSERDTVAAVAAELTKEADRVIDRAQKNNTSIQKRLNGLEKVSQEQLKLARTAEAAGAEVLRLSKSVEGRTKELKKLADAGATSAELQKMQLDLQAEMAGLEKQVMIADQERERFMDAVKEEKGRADKAEDRLADLTQSAKQSAAAASTEIPVIMSTFRPKAKYRSEKFLNMFIQNSQLTPEVANEALRLGLSQSQTMTAVRIAADFQNEKRSLLPNESEMVKALGNIMVREGTPQANLPLRVQTAMKPASAATPAAAAVQGLHTPAAAAQPNQTAYGVVQQWKEKARRVLDMYDQGDIDQDTAELWLSQVPGIPASGLKKAVEYIRQ